MGFLYDDPRDMPTAEDRLLPPPRRSRPNRHACNPTEARTAIWEDLEDVTFGDFNYGLWKQVIRSRGEEAQQVARDASRRLDQWIRSGKRDDIDTDTDRALNQTIRNIEAGLRAADDKQICRYARYRYKYLTRGSMQR